MRTVGSLQELGEIFGRGSMSPPGSSHRPKECDSGCNGGVYRVYDVVRGITTPVVSHPGILCSGNNRNALFSMGTDFCNINRFYISEYFPIQPTQQNGLEKLTGFSRSLEAISGGLLQSLPSIGHLGDSDCQVCMGNTAPQESSNR